MGSAMPTRADPGNPAGLASGTIEVMYTLLGDVTWRRSRTEPTSSSSQPISARTSPAGTRVTLITMGSSTPLTSLFWPPISARPTAEPRSHCRPATGPHWTPLQRQMDFRRMCRSRAMLGLLLFATIGLLGLRSRWHRRGTTPRTTDYLTRQVIASQAFTMPLNGFSVLSIVGRTNS